MLLSDVDYINIFQMLLVYMFCSQMLMMNITYVHVNDVNGNINDGNGIINDGNGNNHVNGAVFEVYIYGQINFFLFQISSCFFYIYLASQKSRNNLESQISTLSPSPTPESFISYVYNVFLCKYFVNDATMYVFIVFCY